MKNVAKINLEIKKCKQCPFGRHPEGYESWFCVHDMINPGLEVGDGSEVPDYCPFVTQRLKRVLEAISGATATTMPKKYINEVERKQKNNDPDPKFGADHAWNHIRNVQTIGKDFLNQCYDFGYTDSSKIEKQALLFEIAAFFHDIGLAESARGHAIHSSELAKKCLSKYDIDEEDLRVITHAIANHSDGMDTRTMIDAALVLADKLDVTRDRIVRITDNITRELTKVEKASFVIKGKNGKAEEAVLEYETEEGFDPMALRDWPKSIMIPKMITEEFLKIAKFTFLVNGEEIDVKNILH